MTLIAATMLERKRVFLIKPATRESPDATAIAAREMAVMPAAMITVCFWWFPKGIELEYRFLLREKSAAGFFSE